MSDKKLYQEFYCNDCDGYIVVKLNMAINRTVKVVCPECGRQHPRQIKDGHIVGDSHRENAEEIIPTKSAYHKKPMSNIGIGARASTKIEKPDDIVAKRMMSQSWFEKFAGKLAGKQ